MFSESDKNYMLLAVNKAREGIALGQTPFAACIVSDDGRVMACGHNVVWQDMDITAHGEVNTIRQACRQERSIDLSGATIYSTTEPCPMCFAAIHWARIKRIVYGASIADARLAGFHELMISNETMKKEGGAVLSCEGGCLQEECVALFREWQRAGKARVY
jgi:tRNA(Arg) A34 adenosine deaminase TadA